MRQDISKNLIHFTKNSSQRISFRDDKKTAFENLLSIVTKGKIYSSSVALIKGSHRVVCFTEAPLINLERLVNAGGYSTYSPFGILISKRLLFEKGGRPVIYQTDEEYNNLNKSNNWRHVRYNPLAEPPIDLTWEREWRIKADYFEIDESNSKIVLPFDFRTEFIQRWNDHFDTNARANSDLLGISAQNWTRPFRWEFVSLSES